MYMIYFLKFLRKVILQILVFRRTALTAIKRNHFSPGFIRISSKARLELEGENIYFGYNTHIGTNVSVASNVLIASNVSFVGGDHDHKVHATTMFASSRPKMRGIKIEENTWIGHGAIILDGVTISEGSVIGAGAVVTKSFPQNSIVVGNPGFVVSRRLT